MAVQLDPTSMTTPALVVVRQGARHSKVKHCALIGCMEPHSNPATLSRHGECSWTIEGVHYLSEKEKGGELPHHSLPLRMSSCVKMIPRLPSRINVTWQVAVKLTVHPQISV